ncbi:helix-turn-helix transcriptional regulator [Chitinophaga polysaccharea]|uniref:AraC family transcriptional regulator n=1 Tax=Chitinophaga TaxID=79328 RepID=UPI0014550FD8|nr:MULTISPECIES: AraC family transcriptional regulator [Chitinophaga]NLR62570.1 helix-turn-helix transcriptional regulator [Chitinophaga polysaccharea]NLU91496.1 helix-turn-helix transcriptional regulator [Chitinophaga sp. Ak27]
MQYIYENFTFPPDQSFTIRSEILEIKKYTTLKSHINFEIALIENCAGKRFIGDHIEDFEGTELVLLGSYLPHCWQYYTVLDPMIPPQATVIHFFPTFLGQQLLDKPEAHQLNDLFERAAKGVSFSGATVRTAKMIMQQMLFTSGMTRVVLMLNLLDTLAQSEEGKVLSSPYYNAVDSSIEAQKINKVFDYIFKNFQEEISLKTVADILPLSPAAFCRYFKARTNRTLIDFVKEVRIGHAAKLLLEKKHNVTEACYQSGYNNLSNFNKHFKEVKGLSPRDFVKQYSTAE